MKATDTLLTTTTQKLTQLQQTQASKGVTRISNCQDNISEVFLAGVSKTSDKPYHVTLSTKDLLSTQVCTTSATSRQNLATAVHSIPNELISISSSRNGKDNQKVSTEHEQQEELPASSSKHRIVHEIKHQPGSLLSKGSVVVATQGSTDRQHLNSLHPGTSLLKDRIISGVVGIESDNSAPVKAMSSVNALLLGSSSKAKTVIVTQRPGVTSPTTTALVRHGNEIQANAHNSVNNTSAKPTTTQNSVHTSVLSHSGSKTILDPVFTLSSVTSNRQGDQHGSEKTEGTLTAHPTENIDSNAHKETKQFPDPSQFTSSIDSSQPLVNGTSDCGGSESTDVLASSEPMSPKSFTSSCASIEVDVNAETTSHASSMTSPGQQRKSGRVRTLKSPDPDYITPTTKGNLSCLHHCLYPRIKKMCLSQCQFQNCYWLLYT